jgi:diadenosine tetraphosphate (Ap4A) HIT family hydrolase
VIVQKVAKAIRKALRPDGVIVAAFNGEAAGQTVYHLHFHVISLLGHEAVERTRSQPEG